MAGLIYLASPYSSPSENVRNERFSITTEVVAKLLIKGNAVFSPIVYGHRFSRQIGTAFEPWQRLNDEMIRASAEIWVLTLPGWKGSRGVFHEVSLAGVLSKPLRFIDVSGNFIARPR